MNEKREDQINEELNRLLLTIDPDQIWRSVCDLKEGGNFKGRGLDNDGLDQPSGIDFKNKTVADLGCNIGSYTFQALEEGATRADGYDIDPKIIQAAKLVKQLKHVDNANYFSQDFQIVPKMNYDIAMLIDVIGKRNVATGILKELLNALEQYSDSMLVLTVRRFYSIKKNLKTTPEALTALYGEAEIRGDNFYLIDYISRFYSSKWQIQPYVEQNINRPEYSKILIFFLPLEKQSAAEMNFDECSL